MHVDSFTEQIRQLACQALLQPMGLREHRFDLTRGETHEGFVFRGQRSEDSAIEQFIVAALQQVLVRMGVAQAEYELELELFEIQPFSGRLGDTSAWLQATPSERSRASWPEDFSASEQELRDAECIYYLHEVGPAPVQEFVVACTAAEYIAVYWYTSG